MYLQLLSERADRDVASISSEELAELAGVNAAKVRKDLSYLGSHGTRGVGYDVGHLIYRIRYELGLEQDWTVVIVGAGNLGLALTGYAGFDHRGFRVVALVDIDADKVGKSVNGLVVQPFDDIDEIVRTHAVSMGVIATPASNAQAAADRLVSAGVSSILNFAPAVLAVPREVGIRNVDLAVELQILSYHDPNRNQHRTSSVDAPAVADRDVSTSPRGGRYPRRSALGDAMIGSAPTEHSRTSGA